MISKIATAISSNEIISAMVWGGAGIFLFLFPLLYYIKRFYWSSNRDEKSHFEIIATALVLQITIVSVMSVAAYFSNQLLAGGTAYDAKSGIRLFYLGVTKSNLSENIDAQSSADGLKLWKIWKPLSINLNSGNVSTSEEKGVKAGSAILIFYISILLYFTLFAIPLGMFLFPIFLTMRKNNDNSKRYSLGEKIGNTMVLFFSIIAVFYMHQAIANGYVSVFGGIDNFSFWRMTQEVWKSILQVEA